MAAQQPNRTNIFGFYVLGGRPVVVRPGHGPETHDGQWVDWIEWAHHAVQISRKDYLALVRRVTREGGPRAQGLHGPTIPPSGRPRTARRPS
jgi:hypothetical protein